MSGPDQGSNPVRPEYEAVKPTSKALRAMGFWHKHAFWRKHLCL